MNEPGKTAYRRSPSVLLLWAAVAGMAGCAAATSGGRARPLAIDQSQLGVVAEGSVMSANLPGGRGALPWMQLGVGYRRGVADGVEAGARLSGMSFPQIATVGAVTDVKLRLRDGSRGGLDAAVAPGASYQFVRLDGEPWHLAGVSAPLLFGKNLGRHQLIFGPRLVDQLLVGAGRLVNFFYLGASVAFAWRVSSSLDLTPELAFLYSPVTFGGHDPDTRERGFAVMQLGIGGSYDL